MSQVPHYIRHSVRSLLRRPGFAAIVVTTIALGIGANTAIFSIVNGVLLEPLPVRDQERIVVPDVISPLGYSISLSIPNFRDWRERNRTFESFGAIMNRNFTLTGIDRPEVVETRLILGDFFEAIGVDPLRGRVIPSDDTWAGAEPVAVVTYRFWQDRLGGVDDPLGQSIVLDGMSFTIVGVLPEPFVFPTSRTAVFVPMGFFAESLCWDQRGCSQGSWGIGRLRAGVTLEAAQADMDRVVREIEEIEGERQSHAQLQTLATFYVGDVQRQIWVLMGAVVFVLLIACANVASLLLARGEARRREVAVRMALGAGRRSMLGMFLTESLLIAAISGLLGVAIAFAAVRVMTPAIAGDLPSALAGRVGIDATVMVFTFLLTIGAGLLFGTLPAWRGSAPRLSAELKEGGRGAAGGSRQRMRSALVVAEVALSLVLLIGAGLMLQSTRRLQQVEKGFVEDNVFTARIGLPTLRYPAKEDAWTFYREARDRVAALPGVDGAAFSNIIPLQGNSWENGIYPEGVPIEPENVSSVLYYIVSPEYFDALGVDVVRGRGFTDADREGSVLVAVIDERMAGQFWPGEDPIGKRVTFETEGEGHGSDGARVFRTVVGVTRNVRHYELENPSRIQIYVPMDQSLRGWSSSMYLVAKTQGEPLALTEQVRRVITELDAEVPLYSIETMEGYVGDAMAGTAVVSGFLTAFSALAILLSAIGIFGVVSYQVAHRLREIGIRMALGAAARDVLRLVAWQGLVITSTGVVLGLVGAYGLTRLLASMLYGVNPTDPVTYAGFAVFLVTVALIALLIPTRRATRTDPAIVLREE